MAKPQVFISYAHADDQRFDEETRGWVTNFVDKLAKAIETKPGGSQVECWMDHRLEPQREVDDALHRLIQDSVCIVAFMSPRYLASEWCRLEMETFVKLVGGGKAGDRVFLVEMLETDRSAWHPGIRAISVVKLWEKSIDQPEPMTLGWPVPNPKSDRAYWRELNDLASVLARQIQGLPQLPSVAPPEDTASAPAPSRPGKTVWIADPTDDVSDQWDALAASLRENGHQVLPKHVASYPLEDESLYRKALADDLARAGLLVQLLGGFPGRKPGWSDQRLTPFQAELAKAEAQRRNLELVFWRLPGIDPDTVADAGLKALLAETNSVDFDSFRTGLLNRLSPTPSSVTPDASMGAADTVLSVVINADKPDRDLGKRAQDMLGELDVEATLAAEPLPTQAPAEYRQQLEAQLEATHGVLIVYGAAPPSWVQVQHAWVRKVLALRRKGIWEAVLDAPPEDKPDHGLARRNLMLLDCRRGLSVDPLKLFVDTLRQGV